VRNPVLPISLAIFSISFSLPEENGSGSLISVNTPAGNKESSVLYTSMALQRYGLSQKAFDQAVKGFRQLQQQQRLRNNRYLSICDFSQSSRKKRFYLVDMMNEKLVLHTYVAHGRNSGGEFATRFSNRTESHQSSLGFYLTADTYYGEHGLSLKLKGLESGINDKALHRKIVIHGADYAEPARIRSLGYLGRSYGCPALPKKESNYIISKIKNGSCLFIYHPSAGYAKGSKLLND